MSVGINSHQEKKSISFRPPNFIKLVIEIASLSYTISDDKPWLELQAKIHSLSCIVLNLPDMYVILSLKSSDAFQAFLNKNPLVVSMVGCRV